jgi:hypothetical protein
VRQRPHQRSLPSTKCRALPHRDAWPLHPPAREGARHDVQEDAAETITAEIREWIAAGAGG